MDRVLQVLDFLAVASSSFSCPYHCGSSTLIPFLLGLLTGLAVGIAFCALAACWVFFGPLHSLQVPPARTFPAARVHLPPRLRGYLHEHTEN